MTTLAKWSIKDYHQMIKASILSDRHVELLAGEIIEMGPEGPLHRKFNDSIAEYLRDKLRDRAKIYEAHPITLPDSEPEPDISIVKLPVSLYDNCHPSSAQIYLLIEISDTTLEKDLEEKRIIYAHAGILEYWVIDLKNQQLIVFQKPLGEDYQIKQAYHQGTIRMVAFQDLELSVERLLNNRKIQT